MQKSQLILGCDNACVKGNTVKKCSTADYNWRESLTEKPESWNDSFFSVVRLGCHLLRHTFQYQHLVLFKFEGQNNDGDNIQYIFRQEFQSNPNLVCTKPWQYIIIIVVRKLTLYFTGLKIKVIIARRVKDNGDLGLRQVGEGASHHWQHHLATAQEITFPRGGSWSITSIFGKFLEISEAEGRSEGCCASANTHHQLHSFRYQQR